MSPPGNAAGPRPITEGAAIANNIAGGDLRSLPASGDIPGLTAVQGSIFDKWLESDSEPLGGRPTGGVEQAEANADTWWNSTARAALHAEARTGRIFEPFDLVARYGIAEPDHPNRWGALFRSALRERTVRRVGYGPSKRPTRNHGITGLYQGVGWSQW
jgi:hypothetical protein